MLCKKCGKEIQDKQKCPYCRWENYYEHEDIPEHLKYIRKLSESTAYEHESGDEKEYCLKDAADKSDCQKLGEGTKRKYGVSIKITTAIMCFLCVCLGFIAGSYVERQFSDTQAMHETELNTDTENESAAMEDSSELSESTVHDGGII